MRSWFLPQIQQKLLLPMQPFSLNSHFVLSLKCVGIHEENLHSLIINSWVKREVANDGGEEDSIEWMGRWAELKDCSAIIMRKSGCTEMKRWKRMEKRAHIRFILPLLCGCGIMYPFGPDMITINIVVIIIITIKSEREWKRTKKRIGEWKEMGKRYINCPEEGNNWLSISLMEMILSWVLFLSRRASSELREVS